MKQVLTILTNSPLLCALKAQASAGNAAKPNIIVILPDDLGYGEVQCNNPERGKIPTPNIDKLAAQGMLLIGRLFANSLHVAHRPLSLSHEVTERHPEDLDLWRTVGRAGAHDDRHTGQATAKSSRTARDRCRKSNAENRKQRASADTARNADSRRISAPAPMNTCRSS